MSSIQLSGLSTGIDTQTIVQQLVEAEKSRLKSYQVKLAAQQERRTVVNELQTKLSALKTAISKLSDSSQLRSYNAKSSDEDTLTVSASSNAYEGSHTIQVKQLATADRWVHEGYKYATSEVGAGTMLISYNHQQMVIQTGDRTTLQDLVNLINNDNNNPGITASLLQYNAGNGKNIHLVLSGQSGGSDYQITVDSSSAEVRTASSLLTANTSNAALTTKLSDLDDFSGQSMNFAFLDQVAIRGTLHDGTAVNTTIAVNSFSTVEDLIGEIEEAFGDTVKVSFEDGQLKVTDKTTGVSQMTLELDFITDDGGGPQTATLSTTRTVEGGAMTTTLAGMGAANFTQTQSAQDAMFKVDGYPQDVVVGETVEERWITRSSNTVDDVITGLTLNLHATTANTAGTGYDSVNVSATRDTKALKEKLEKMIEAYNELMTFYKDNTTFNTETKTSGKLSSEYTLTSLRSQLKSLINSNAVGFTANDAFKNASEIGLTVNAEGMMELDANKFDEAIVDDYNSVLALLGATKTGSTSGTDAAFLKFYGSSNSTSAGTYNVRINADGTALIKLENEAWSQARSATVLNNYVYGNSEMDENGKPRHPEYDLQLSVDAVELAKNRQMDVTLNVRQGVATGLNDQLNRTLKVSTGTVPVAVKNINSRISLLEDRIDTEEIRLDAYKKRLTARYARLERNLALIQQQFSGIR
jgi:flagellar hook-associated protein 2